MNNIVLVGDARGGQVQWGVLLASPGHGFCGYRPGDSAVPWNAAADMIDNSGFLKSRRKQSSGSYNHAVIATGGSAVYSGKAMARLKERAVIIYLKADLETIHRRISNIATRGIAMGRDRTLSDIYYERARLYELYADIIIDCDNKDAEGVVESILESLDNFNP